MPDVRVSPRQWVHIFAAHHPKWYPRTSLLAEPILSFRILQNSGEGAIRPENLDSGDIGNYLAFNGKIGDTVTPPWRNRNCSHFSYSSPNVRWFILFEGDDKWWVASQKCHLIAVVSGQIDRDLHWMSNNLNQHEDRSEFGECFANQSMLKFVVDFSTKTEEKFEWESLNLLLVRSLVERHV